MKIHILASTLLLASPLINLHAQSVEVFSDYSVPQVDLVIKELESTLGETVTRRSYNQISGQKSGLGLVLLFSDDKAMSQVMQNAGAEKTSEIKPQGFSIRKTTNNGKETVWLVAKDKAGFLYGGYELSEQIRCYGTNQLQETDQNPYMEMRGTKFNIPLDVRSPSYTDPCDAAQNNIVEMWNFNFWKEYIESLARHRYNYISCWNLHPFPSLVKVPGYEDVALADVQRSTVRWKENYSLEGVDFDTPEIRSNVEILKKMTIEEKIVFWRKVMAYGKLHNIDFYFVTWNIFTNGIDGKYGITDKTDNPITRDYFRKSVKQMFLTYPDLKGIGLTTGENMRSDTFEEKEDWAYETYARGVLDVVKEQPDRQITFIHRQHMAGALEIADKFKPLIDHPNIEFIYSFKYAKAHVYSSTKQNYHRGFVKDIQDRGDLKTIWTLRNDDVFYFRWGAPDFVREFIQNIPYDVSRGYYYGSDQYVWGREFLMREPEYPRQLEINKHWYQWMLWGRLGYNPEMSNQRFTQIIKAAFPGVDAGKLFTAWQEASMIYPKTTGFHWGALDFIWYIEGSQSRPFTAQTPSGFHDVNRFITMGTHPAADNISIPNYVKAHVAGKSLTGTTPFEVAQQIHDHSDKALSLLSELNLTGNKELRQTLDDIQTIAWLGKYYAHKIEAATELALFRETNDLDRQKACIRHLNKSAAYWRSYTSLAVSNYNNPLWTNRVGHVDWRENFLSALYDIRAVGGKVDLPSMEPSKGGTILEAENANWESLETESEIPGFSGSGYVLVDRHEKQPSITWTYDAQASGRHVLEFRYINTWGRNLDSPVSVNGDTAGELGIWESGSGSNWVWDRVVVDLNKGKNSIRLEGGGQFYIDHLNVMPLFE